MKCPICIDENLVMTDRQGIEIDYCPKCRGVWLDRGELDKLIERSSAVAEPQPQSNKNYRESFRSSSNHGYDKKKKGGLLGELFNF